ncbi:50S ribosomal protein L24, partial [Bacillus velezensis]|uniref:50S ribosomal protein L24 n=1 Tax=Bacillus velezensis TaxID=492670 RepID=UPI0011A5C0D4
MDVKKGDKVMVMCGKDKGKEGRMVGGLGKKEGVVVEGVKMVKKECKGTEVKGEGGISNEEGGIDAS